jgi:hypothetical protein
VTTTDQPRPIHVYPVNDLRDHVINGDPCPCLPRTEQDGAIVIHHSYDGREAKEKP